MNAAPCVQQPSPSARPAAPARVGAEVVHVVESLDRGGLERVVIDLIRAQRLAGMRCRVVCLFGRGSLASELADEGVDVRACDKRPGLDLAALSRMRGLLAESPGAILHTHNATAHYHAVAAALGLAMHRVVNTRHGMGAQRNSGRSEWLFRHAMRRTDIGVTVCEAARRQFTAQGVHARAELVTIRNGIALQRFLPASDACRAELAEELALPPGTTLIGSVGRLTPAKDQATLVRAYRRVHSHLPGTALLLVGSGSLRGQLEQVAAAEGVGDAVHFLGDRSDVPRILRGLDLFVLPSLTEGYSVALLEACAASLPVVATDVGGNAEIIRHGVNGLVTRAGDAEALAQAMVLLLQDRQAATAMGAAGRRWVLRNGSFQAMAERYARIYGSRQE